MKQNEKIFKSRANKLAEKYIANFDGDGFWNARNKLHCQILRDEISKFPKKNWDFLRDFGINIDDLESTANEVSVYVIDEMNIAAPHPQYDPVTPHEIGDEFAEFFKNLDECYNKLNTINECFAEYHDTKIFDFIKDLTYNETITEERLNEIDNYLN